MDRKFKLLAASSVVVALASGCTPYNARTGTYDNTEYGAGTSQGASQNQDPQPETCAPCKANNSTTAEHSQQWYIDRWNRQQQTQQNKPYSPPPKPYTPPKTTYRPPAAQGEHSQQWYIDRWNRQQQAQQNRPRYTPPKPYVASKPYVAPKKYTAPKPYTPPKKTYSGYGGAKKNSTNYYDYSNAGGYSSSNKSIYTGAAKATSNSASNKSIYTGASATKNSSSNKSIYTGNYNTNTYKPYSPKTYTSGANSNSSNSNNSYSSNNYDTYTGGGTSNNTYVAPSSSSSSSSYSGSEVATGSYKSGDANYTVQKKDTVFSVMRLTGVYWKEIIKMNNLTAPYTISPGQSLRLK